MTVGLSPAGLATPWLNTMRGGGAGTSFTAPATLFVQLHTNAGDPGSAGTSNVSSTTTRQAVTFNASSAGSSLTISNTPTWSTWAGTNGEVVAHISVWSASTSGTFYFSATLTALKTVNTGDTLTLTGLTFALTPQAA